ncbi:NAD-dependent epimerase/dehydratase family protein [Hwanghaeella sp. 1Z406]|jgi:nucleoside-diphosphate-sugar epimerase|uniref:NAD-dependent epimerase/dehydratase family protein n=1 Tax=Hwanghaeella sp. 1Z406 TaxID=3402811 RepID=UPI0026998732|tara:strand:- start:7609 stop:8514 length:906 start_codon:yes stop_codon:yes gene_type:complete
MVDETLKPGSTVLVTGASGFVGRAVCATLTRAGYKPRPVGRHDVGEIHRGTDWGQALQECQAVVHLAARVHIMGHDSAKGEDAFREVNLHGTANLVRQAADRGIGRFVFMSTIKVLGENGVEVTPDDPPAPFDAYAVSKTEAEAAVRELSGDMETVILRPPLVYGPGVKANFERLMHLVASGWPLPFGAIENQRSLIYIDNLADAVRHALTCHPGTYHPKDSRDFSTANLVRLLAQGMGRRCFLLPVPVALMRGMGRLTGTYPAVARLTGSFTSNGAMDGWEPPVPAEQAMLQTARAFAES